MTCLVTFLLKGPRKEREDVMTDEGREEDECLDGWQGTL